MAKTKLLFQQSITSDYIQELKNKYGEYNETWIETITHEFYKLYYDIDNPQIIPLDYLFLKRVNILNTAIITQCKTLRL